MATEDEDSLFLYQSNEDEDSVTIDIAISSEQDIWDLVRVLSDKGDNAPNISVRLEDLSWAKLNVVYDGADFKQSLTADAMKG